jgi:Domain of unknown function (DUF6817)
MPASFDEMIAFLRQVAAADVPHSGGTYLGHVVTVYRDLKKWGYDDEVACGGLFHSIYGTGLFQKFKLPLESRDKVRALIGERAERLAYLFCAVVYDSLDAEIDRGTPPYQMTDRFTGGPIAISEEDFEDLLRIQLVDRLEQIPRSKEWDFRRDSYRRIAERLGPHALAQYERVFALEAEPA